MTEKLTERAAARLRAELAHASDQSVELRLAKVAFELADEATSEALRRVDVAGRPACTKGCPYCCYDDFAISWPEALVLARYLTQRLHPDNALTLAGVLVDFEAATAGLSRVERFNSEMGCPLLDEDSGSCVVHPARPLRCRAMTSPAVASCERHWREGGVPPEPNEVVSVIHEAVARALAAVCEEAGISSDSTSFPAALRAALEAVI